MSTNFCKQCGKPVLRSRYNKFCNHSCAASYNNVGRTHSDATKHKISNKLKKRESVPKSKKYKISRATGEIIDGTHSVWAPNVRARFVKHVCSHFNIPFNDGANTIVGMNGVQKLITYDYNVLQLSSTQIKEKYNILLPNGHMPAFLKQLGIERRTHSEALLICIQNGRLNIPKVQTKYKTGWHIGWDGVKHYYRSSYEESMYMRLDSSRRKYESEPVRIRYFNTSTNNYRTAIPDIVLDETIILEIKSDYTYDSDEMGDKFKAYKANGYKPLLILEGKVWRCLPESNRRK